MPARAFDRTTQPWTLSVGAGDPAPSLINIGLGYQIHEMLEIKGGTGYLWWNDLNVQSLGASVRVDMFPTRLTPVFGAGLDLLIIRGTGDVQGLSTSTLLGSLTAGLDWCITDDVRTTAGFTFHFPLRLNWPFLEIGFMF